MKLNGHDKAREIALRERTQSFIAAIEGMAGLAPEAIGYTLLGEAGLAHWLACRAGTAYLDDVQFVQAFDRVTNALPFCPVELPPELEDALQAMQAERQAAGNAATRQEALAELRPETRQRLLAALAKIGASDGERPATLLALASGALRAGRRGFTRPMIDELRHWCGMPARTITGLRQLPEAIQDKVRAAMASLGAKATKVEVSRALRNGTLVAGVGGLTPNIIARLQTWCAVAPTAKPRKTATPSR